LAWSQAEGSRQDVPTVSVLDQGCDGRGAVMKLTDKQRQHLQVLAAGERSAYPGLHMGTLQSLQRKGLAIARHQPGSMAMPHVCIQWRLTESGLCCRNLIRLASP
jgi:hypothetical protein